MTHRRAIGTIPLDELSVWIDVEGLGEKRGEIHQADKPQTWRRTSASEAIRFQPGIDPEYQTLARYVIAQAVCDARLGSKPMALVALRARRWLRATSADLRFWCDRAGIQPDNLIAWATAQFDPATDPVADPVWLKPIVEARRRAVTSRAQAEQWMETRPDLSPLRPPQRPRGRPRKTFPLYQPMCPWAHTPRPRRVQ